MDKTARDIRLDDRKWHYIHLTPFFSQRKALKSKNLPQPRSLRSPSPQETALERSIRQRISLLVLLDGRAQAYTYMVHGDQARWRLKEIHSAHNRGRSYSVYSYSLSTLSYRWLLQEREVNPMRFEYAYEKEEIGKALHHGLEDGGQIQSQ